MREAFGRMGWVGGVLGVLGLLAPAHGVTVSFKAVKKNAATISPPVSTVSAAPNDTIEVNIFASGWAPNLTNGKVQTYEVKANARTGYYNNGGPGFILPKGWNAALDLTTCDSALDCQDAVPTAPACNDQFCQLACNSNAQCLTANPAHPTCSDQSQCIGPNHAPSMGAFITEARADWIFAPPLGAIQAVSTRSLDYRFGATVFNGVGALDTGVEKYLGTLILVVSPTACGTYSVGAINAIESTFVEITNGLLTESFLPTISPLTINLSGNCGACCDPDSGDCSITTEAACNGDGGMFKGPGSVCTPQTCFLCPTVVAANPPNCAIDARLPNTTTSATKLGFTSVDITFSAPLPVPPAVGNFTVAVTPDQAAANPSIIGVTAQPSPPAAPNTFRLTFDPLKPVPQRAWSCFTYTGCAPGPKVCLGALPMDVNQSRVSEVSQIDLTALVNGLNADQVEVNPLKDFQCDLDRSGGCTSADIVTWVDMANGASTFLPVLIDKEIAPVCPSATP